jgi:hypothetical protein
MKKTDDVAALERPTHVPSFGQWTPVTVAMPARAKPVILCVKSAGWTKGHYKGGPQDVWYSETGKLYQNGVDVVAWMPGPPMP